jgi:hypothetical protein
MNAVDIVTLRFNRWRPVMEKILRQHSNYTSVEDIYNRCMALQLFFFDNARSFAVINVVFEGNITTLHVMLAGGDLDALLELERVVTTFGKELGAKRYTLIGRKGFARALKNHGWKAPFVYLEKEI